VGKVKAHAAGEEIEVERPTRRGRRRRTEPDNILCENREQADDMGAQPNGRAKPAAPFPPAPVNPDGGDSG